MVSIIGAGPSGSYLAYLLAKSGFKADVYEEHKFVGKPVQCTGLITGSLNSIINVDDSYVVNKLSNIRLVAPNGKSIEFKLKRPNYLVDRQKFDNHFYEIAMNEGAEYNIGHKLIDFRRTSNGFEMNFGKKKKFTDVLVGADGVNSAVSWNKPRFLIGKQARFKGNFDSKTFVAYLWNYGFSWIVPENERTARIGVIGKSVENGFNELKRMHKLKLLEWQSGMVPLYDRKIKTENKNIYLLGDAAGMVKATTYGGIIYGLMAAEELRKSLINGSSYEMLWRKRFGKELYISLLIRKILDKMKNEDYNELVEMFENGAAKSLLEENDRDFPSRFLLKLIIKEPRLLKFLRLII